MFIKYSKRLSVTVQKRSDSGRANLARGPLNWPVCVRLVCGGTETYDGRLKIENMIGGGGGERGRGGWVLFDKDSLSNR